MPNFDVFDHDDYRTLLRAWIAAAPRRSQAMLARLVGVSRSTVAMVLAGERDLPLAQADRWAHAVAEGQAQLYFVALVRADSPVSLDLRRHARAEAASLRDAHRAHEASIEQQRLLGLWFVPVIVELARTSACQLEPAWLHTRIWPEVPLDQLTSALAALYELGVLSTDEHGAVNVDPRAWTTGTQLEGDEVSRIARAYHQVQLEHATRALEEQRSETRFVGSMTVAVDGTRLPDLIAALQRFQLDAVQPFRSEPTEVVQVSFQLFARSV